MFKKIVAILLIVCMSASLMIPGFASDSGNPSDTFRNGFNLTPTNSDSTGITPDTRFLLVSQNNIALEELKKAISIDGEPAPVIESTDKNKYLITPSRPLLENSVYTLRIKLDKETAWSFQTQASFKITGTLPADKAVSVPINSGIEINFSYEDYEDIDNYFEISPTVKGSFERHKKTAVFVPEKLDEGTIYTVKIKKGIKLKNTNRSMDEDYAFSFETGKESANVQKDTYKGFISYTRNIYDFKTGSTPQIPISLYVNDNVYKENTINVDTKVYTYKNFDSFYDALNKKLQIPNWAQVNYNSNYIDVDGLEKIQEFSQTLDVKTDNYFNPVLLNIPKSLPLGYYVVDSRWDDIRFQTFLQVTDIGIYLVKSTTKTLVWLNDLSSKAPMEGASVTFSGNGSSSVSDNKGIAYFDTPFEKNSTNYIFKPQLLKVMTNDGKISVLDCSSYDLQPGEYYWNYLFTDRNMYKPDDTINLWGFVKNRYKNETIRNLTIELNQGYWSSELPVIKQTADVLNGYFDTKLKLPMLEPGGYNLVIKNGDVTISSSYIQVYNYTKPSYKIDITKDKKAVFPGQEVNFNVKASFFEGTGVSNLKMNYFIQEYSIGGNNRNSTGTTDVKGNYAVKYVPKVSGSIQGEQQVRFDVRALLPESGEISESDNVRIFVNDINVDLNGETKDGTGSINAKVNKIVLDRLNNGTAKDNGDYLGDPVGGKGISGTIYKNTWAQKEDGVYYDFINKVTQKKYRYELVKTAVKDFNMTTAADGKASFAFDAPKSKDSYYTAEIKCMDNSGRNMNFQIYIGEHFDYSSYSGNEPYTLEGGKDSYSLGDTVDLTLRKGKSDLPEGNYLFIKSQNGIRSYTVSNKPSFSDKFNEEDVPNTDIKAIYFDGNVYNTSAEYNATFKADDKKLVLEATADKNSYRPGEQATIKINVRDKDGKPVKAFVNTSIVDEAYFKLSDQSVNVLDSIYSGVGSGIYCEIRSHDSTSNRNVWSNVMYDRAGSVEKSIAPAAAQSVKSFEAKGDSSSASVREDFRDTAHFESVQTDESGLAELKFKLPDNVTSWRITLGAISEDMHAGSEKVNMNVTLPFFINYSFNTTYLEGDKPVIGVNAYGDSLKEDDLVMFEVSSVQNPDLKVSAVGKAFERINIPLPGFPEGINDLIIKAYTNSGLSDSVKHTINVVKSYYQIDKADYFDAVPNIGISGGKSGNTRIIFSDRSRGRFLSELVGIYYSDGNRIDQTLSKKIASDLLDKYFKDYEFVSDSENLSLKDYQKTDGGLALLPYTASDVEISAKLAPMAKDFCDSFKLKNYFYDILNKNTSSDRVMALYGLAALREPVLLELDKTAAVENLSLKNSIYLALSYCELGDTAKAKQIFDSRISKSIEEYKPFYRVNTGNDKDDVVEMTSLCAYLASKLNLDQRTGLFDYCVRNYAKDILISVEKLLFISNEIEKYSDKESGLSYSYNGEEKSIKLEKGCCYAISIPSATLPNFKIAGVQGDVSAVSIYKENVLDINKLDKDISVDREYCFIDGKPVKSNVLKQGDIIKVRITWDIGSKALDGGYEITDYLPSGLKPVENYLGNSYYYRNIEGQKVKFYAYDSPYWKDTNRVFEYFARVVSPGTYTAQGTVIQSSRSKESINTGRSEVVEIDSKGEIISTPIDPDGVKVEINGRPVVFDAQPVMKSSRTLVPLRSIFEVLGASVKWDAKTKTVTALKDGKKIVLTVNSKDASINGSKAILDVPATIIGNRTFVPTRFISESMGAKVDWNAGKKTVQITN